MMHLSAHLISLDAFLSGDADGIDRSELARSLKRRFMKSGGIGFARYISNVSGSECLYLCENSWGEEYGHVVQHAVMPFMRVGWRHDNVELYADVSGVWSSKDRALVHGRFIGSFSEVLHEEDFALFAVEPIEDERDEPVYGFLAGALPWLSGLRGLTSRALNREEAIARLEAVGASGGHMDEEAVALHVAREIECRERRTAALREDLKARGRILE